MVGGVAKTKRPYRKIARCVLIHDGRVLAQKGDGHLVLPGGGVDPGESVGAAAKREVMEETGAVISKLIPFHVVRVKWTPAWASTPKRKERFGKFEGEEEHIFIGRVSRFSKPTSSEGDAWKGVKTMSVERAVAFAEASLGQQTHEFQLMQMAKICAIRAARIAAS